MQTLSILIGKRIKEIRESKNIKQVELAGLVDIEPTNLSKIEKGIHLPKDETLKKIISALDIDFNTLLSVTHIQTKEDLLKKINNIIINSSTKDLKFFYKILQSYNEAKH